MNFDKFNNDLTVALTKIGHGNKIELPEGTVIDIIKN